MQLRRYRRLPSVNYLCASIEEYIADASIRRTLDFSKAKLEDSSIFWNSEASKFRGTRCSNAPPIWLLIFMHTYELPPVLRVFILPNSRHTFLISPYLKRSSQFMNAYLFSIFRFARDLFAHASFFLCCDVFFRAALYIPNAP